MRKRVARMFYVFLYRNQPHFLEKTYLYIVSVFIFYNSTNNVYIIGFSRMLLSGSSDIRRVTLGATVEPQRRVSLAGLTNQESHSLTTKRKKYNIGTKIILPICTLPGIRKKYARPGYMNVTRFKKANTASKH